MFGKKKPKSGQKPDSEKGPESPFIAARREWNERYGSIIRQRDNWRLSSFVQSGITTIAVCGLVYAALQSRFIPYVITKDGSGNIENVGYAVKVPDAGVQVIRAYLIRWIQDSRTVTTDPVLQKQMVLRLFSMIPKESHALVKATEYFRAHSPFDRAATEEVAVDVNDPLSLSDKSWAVTWVETTRDHSGAVTGPSVHWKATLQASQVPPEGKTDLQNPLGVWITDFDWGVER